MTMPQNAQIFMFLFLMLGPFKVIAPFAKLTRNASPSLTRQLAIRSILFSSAALLVAALLGERIIGNYGIPMPILAFAGGLILFLVALNVVIQQFSTNEPHVESAAAPTLAMAINPLAFPTIVTPYGIAAVIVYMTISPDPETKLTVGLTILGIMLANLLVMLITKKIFKVLAVLLPILAAVLGVVQVALGLMIMYNQSKNLFNF
jgi:multiple antibiotic resistance protein